MALQTTLRAKTQVLGAIKLARTLEESENDFKKRLKELLERPLLKRLTALGAIETQSRPNVYFSTHNAPSWCLRNPSEGIGSVLNNPQAIKLIQKIGQEKFQKYFLGEEAVSDQKTGEACGVTSEETQKLRNFVQKFYIQSEFDSLQTPTNTSPTFSAVAHIDLEKGKPFIGFFYKEIWQKWHRINENRLEQTKKELSAKEIKELNQLIHELSAINQRKNTLYSALEKIIEVQREFLISGNIQARKPLTQKALAAAIETNPSVLNRLILNKSVELPWGMQIPIKELLPSSKSLILDQLGELIRAKPNQTDKDLAQMVNRLHGTNLSRRSIAQYRKELGLTPKHERI